MLTVVTVPSLRDFLLFLMVETLFLTFVLKSEASDLTDVLARGFSFQALETDTTGAAQALAPELTAAAISPAIAQAVAEVPLVSVGPPFFYRRDPQFNVYERLTAPGPLFGERAITLSKGRFDFSVGFAYVDFSDLNGTDLDNIRSPGLVRDVFFDERELKLEDQFTGDKTFFAPTSNVLIRTRIDLKVYIIVPALRYGIADNWDVGLSVPILHTSLRVRNETVPVVDAAPPFGVAYTEDTQGNRTNFEFTDSNLNKADPSQVPFVKSQRPSRLLAKADGSATGVGDITLHSTYRFWPTELGGAAFGLNLQLPSGEVRDFHGTGDTHLITALYLSNMLGERFEPYLNVGLDFNANDVDRSSFLYAVGGTLGIKKRLGVTVGVVGRSEFGKLAVQVPQKGYINGVTLDRDPDTCTTGHECYFDVSKQGVPVPFFPEKVKRNYLADFTFGLRYVLRSSSIFFGGVVPLNNDGFRPDFIPSVGMEYTF